MKLFKLALFSVLILSFSVLVVGSIQAVGNVTILSTVRITENTTNGPGAASLDVADRYGTPVGLGDLDGDGVRDIAVGAGFDEGTAVDSGAVYIHFMNTDGSINSTVKLDDTTTNGAGTLGLEASDHYGSSIANIGDLNGDGVIDLAVGAFFDEGTASNSGAVYIHFMNTDGSIKSTVKLDDTTTNGAGTLGLEADDNYGSAVAGLGDLDGDGVKDIVVGARSDEGTDLSSGAIYIHYLNTNGSIKSTVKIDENTTNGPGAASLDADDFYGSSIANIGDLNNDGVIDLAVGARQDEGGANLSSGAVYIHFMNTDGSIDSTVKLDDTTTNGAGTLGLEAGDVYGSAVDNIGDLDGDGVKDILVGAFADEGTGSGSGAVYIHFMNTNGSVKSTVKIDNTTTNGPSPSDLTAGDSYGTGVAGIGDLNKDGVLDIAVGAVNDEGTDLSSGALYIHFLSVSPKNSGSSVSNIGSGSVTLNGTINNTGGEAPTVRGFVYGLTTAYGATTTESGSFSTGSFSANVSGLSCNTLYHFRSYATNNSGTGYGSDQTFSTSGCTRSSGVIYCTLVRTTFCRQRSGFTPAVIPTVASTPTTSPLSLPLVSTTSTTTATTTKFVFTKDLFFGSFGPMVKSLQIFLNEQGFILSQYSYGSPGQETNYFGPLTRAALIRFQEAYDIEPPKGYFGPITRGVVEWLTR